jgi:DNA-binding SARP family transcriptional activator
VSLDPSIFRTDLDDFLHSVDSGNPTVFQLNLEDINSSFLRGYDDVDPSFATWMTVKRENVRRMLIQDLEARLADVPNRPEETKRIARALVQIDPTHEVACQKLMKAYIDLGSTASALAVYKQLWEHLEEEYDIEPSAATQELAVAIKCGQHMPRFAGVTPLSVQVDPVSEGEVDKITSLAIKFAVAWMTELQLNRTTEQGAERIAGILAEDCLGGR